MCKRCSCRSGASILCIEVVLEFAFALQIQWIHILGWVSNEAQWPLPGLPRM